MPSLFFFLSRAAGLLLIWPLCDLFKDCPTVLDMIEVFKKSDGVKQIGCVAIIFILLVTLWEIMDGLKKVVTALRKRPQTKERFRPHQTESDIKTDANEDDSNDEGDDTNYNKHNVRNIEHS